MIKLSEIRKEKGFSQKEFARLLGISPGNLCEWEKGRIEPSIFYLRKISELLKISVDYLLGLEDDFGNISVNNNAGLTENEKRLLKAFNVLDDIEQEKLIEDAEFYASRSSASVKLRNINNQ